MRIHIRTQGNVSILDLKGPLKLGEPEQTYRERVQELLEGGAKHFLVNLTGVPEMDSSGIGALVRGFSRIKQEGGKCRFFGANQRVLQTLKLVRLDTVLELSEDEATALEGF